ncbi:MAG: hypothetical protein ACK47E_00195, partial [Cyclobacteriaceae bacterium]
MKRILTVSLTLFVFLAASQIVFAQAPTFSTLVVAAGNGSATLTFDTGVATISDGTGNLVPSDFTVSVSGSTNGGSVAANPAVTVTVTHTAGNNSATLNFSIAGTKDGSEILTVTPATGTSIFRSTTTFDAMAGTATITQNLRDQLAPSAPFAAPTAAAGSLINTSENGTFSIAVGSLTSTGAVVGDVLEILVNGASFATPRTQILTAGQISSGFTFTSVALPAPDGAKNITARVTDQAGNVGASSTQLALTLNTSAPTAPSAAPTAAAGPLINASENGA